MTRWQYRVVNLGSFFQDERLVEVLGDLGSSGWELVVIYDKASNWLQGWEKGFALFRKEVPEGEEPQGPWAATYLSGEAEPEWLPPTECLSCNAVMPSGVDTCEACGWSYKAPTEAST